MYEYNALVVRVVDGDTVDVILDLGFDVRLKSRVRLYGIDAPESRTRDLEEKKYGLAAKEFLEKNLAVSSKCVVQTSYDGRGKFGRVLGTFLVHDVSLNQLLVDFGLAVEYSGQNKEEIKAAHLANRKILKL